MSSPEQRDEVEMLAMMLLIRRFEERASQQYQAQKIGGFCHLYIGQEAVVVGALAATRPDDYVITAYRDHAHALARGTSADACMAELFGKVTGCSRDARHTGQRPCPSQLAPPAHASSQQMPLWHVPCEQSPLHASPRPGRLMQLRPSHTSPRPQRPALPGANVWQVLVVVSHCWHRLGHC